MIERPDRTHFSPRSVSSRHVVGIGASAGGLEALFDLFGPMNPRIAMSFVVVTHLSPQLESRLTGILSYRTRLRVRCAEEGARVEFGVVDVMPPNVTVSIAGGILHLAARGPGLNLPIDRFLTALADDSTTAAVGVVLSGMGKDGTSGVRAIKRRGGRTFAQEPESAKFPGMPRSAIASGSIHRVLSPIEIGRRLAWLSSGLG